MFPSNNVIALTALVCFLNAEDELKLFVPLNQELTSFQNYVKERNIIYATNINAIHFIQKSVPSLNSLAAKMLLSQQNVLKSPVQSSQLDDGLFLYIYLCIYFLLSLSFSLTSSYLPTSPIL